MDPNIKHSNTGLRVIESRNEPFEETKLCLELIVLKVLSAISSRKVFGQRSHVLQ